MPQRAAGEHTIKKHGPQYLYHKVVVASESGGTKQCHIYIRTESNGVIIIIYLIDHRDLLYLNWTVPVLSISNDV